MTDIEIPLGKRTAQYRFFEILPGAISIGVIAALFILGIFLPLVASIFILLIVTMMFVKAIGLAFRTVQGYVVFNKTRKINWQERLSEFEDPQKHLNRYNKRFDRKQYGIQHHIANLNRISEVAGEYPKPSDILHIDVIPFYNESYEILEPTLRSLADSKYDVKNHLVVVIAYEQRGGKAALDTVAAIEKNWKGVFRELLFVEHPEDIPGEVIGKGPNVTCGGKFAAEWVKEQGLNPENIIVTSQDCDNRPDPNYFAYLTYEWIVTPNRHRVSFQPICLFTNNIWDVPAPMRVVATGNSFWNIISSMRPHLLRNFASHAQSLSALMGMDFWSTRTIVEDGHQYWRSYFYFDGDYTVVPLRIGFGQDAILSNTYWRSIKAQFVQVRRWAYGASDIAYVAKNVFNRDRTAPFWKAFTRFWRLLDSHVTQAVIAPVIAVGAWIPLLINPEASRILIVHELPMAIGLIQQIATIGLLVTMFTSFAMLPERPKRHKKRRRLYMALQWVLMPVTSIIYASSSAYYSQTRLLLGKYMDKFDVTEKFVKK